MLMNPRNSKLNDPCKYDSIFIVEMGFVTNLMTGIGKVAGFASKVGGIAQKFMHMGGTVGKIASGVTKAASTIGALSSLAGGAISKASPYLAGAALVGKALYNTGIADALTGGKASRIVKTVRNWISPNRGIQSNSAVNASIGRTTATGAFSQQLSGG